MGTCSKKIGCFVALTASAFLGLGEISIARAGSSTLPSQSQPAELAKGVSVGTPSASLPSRSVVLDDFEPEPNAPPKGTGGTGTR